MTRDQDAMASLANSEEERLSALMLLLEVSQTFLQSLDLQTVLDVVVATAARETHADLVSVMLLDETGKELKVVAAVGLPEHVAASARQRVGEGISGWVARYGQPLLLREDEPLPESVRYAMRREAVTSALCLPLASKGRVIGVLNLSRLRDSPPFTRADLDLYAVLCAQASIAIENAQLHTELRHAYRELQALDQLKTRFFSVVSHELRTPIHSIQGFIQLLLNDKVTDPDIRRECLSMALKETRRLSRLVDELLDLSRVETGQLEIRWTGVQMGEVVREAVIGLERRAEEAGVSLQMHIASGLPVVAGDPDRLAQVVRNLVDNAIKFTDPGGQVEVTVQRADEGVLVEVKDTGVGIAEEDLPHLFHAFYQVEKPAGRVQKGLGLGLYICKQIVEAHGGRIWAESVPAQRGNSIHGSTFRFIIPLGGH